MKLQPRGLFMSSCRRVSASLTLPTALKKSWVPTCVGMTLWGVLALSLSACKLIDQHTFDPSPEEEPLPVAAAPVKTDARTPLIAIDYATPSPNYRDLLRVAVRAAESRSRQVQYDVVAAVPKLQPGAPPQALEVMRAIAAEGVPAARIHLGLRAEPGLSATQVRVYIR